MSISPTTRLLRLHNGQPITLAERLGIGGEGSVYGLAGQPASVAKIYKDPLTPERARKIEAMIKVGTPELSAMTAWPSGLLLDGTRPVGFVMPRATKAEEIHELYGLKSRRQKFPKAGFRFLVHTAMNVARAFSTVHRHGYAIGDVNERGIMVGQDGQVRLIDCDSFQVNSGTQKFLCEVGVPTFTPPELQAVPSFRGIERTPQHDAFGLAVLVFQLLFLGRHPYAGRHISLDMPIEQAIKEHRFVYSGERQRTQMVQPPNTPEISYSGPNLSRMFEQAFAPGAARGSLQRPSSAQWADALEAFLASLAPCPQNSAHAFVPANGPCPWCKIELTTRVDLFRYVPPSGQTAPSIDHNAIWRALESLQPLHISALPHIDYAKNGLTLSAEAQLLRRHEVETQAISAAQKTLDEASCVLAEHAKQVENFAAEAARQHAHANAFESDGMRLVELQRSFAAVPAARKRIGIFQVLVLVATIAASIGLAIIMADPLTAIPPAALGSVAVGALFLRRHWLANEQSRQTKELHSLRASIDLGPEHRKKLARDADAVLAAARSRMVAVEAKHNTAVLGARFAREKATVGAAAAASAKAAITTRYDAARRALTQFTDKAQPLNRELLAQWKNVEERRTAAHAAYRSIQSLEFQRVQARNRAHDDARNAQLSDYLDQFFIARESWPRIPKSTLASLSSYGIETAADINRTDVLKVPGFGDVRTGLLLDWRAQKETGFRFDPTKGDRSSRLQQEERRLLTERRPHERELMRIKGQIESIMTLAAAQRKSLQDEMRGHVRELAQCLVDSDTLGLSLAPVQLPVFQTPPPLKPATPPLQQPQPAVQRTVRPTYTPPPKHRKRRYSKRWRSRTW